MDRTARWLAALITGVVFAVCLAKSTSNAKGARTEDPRAAYNDWVSRYADKSLESAILQLKLVQEASGGRSPNMFIFTVKSDGTISGQTITDFDTKGFGSTLPDQQSLQRLEKLLLQLPADTGSLPPPERRLLLRTPQTTRVYDLAQLDDSVGEILRLSRCGISSWRPAFQPQSQIDIRAGGVLALCPDGKRVLCGHELLALPTYEFLAKLDLQSENSLFGAGIREAHLAFAPDGTLAAIASNECRVVDLATLKLVGKLAEPEYGRTYPTLDDPQFTPDGRRLVLSCSGVNDGLRFFDTKSWQRADPIAGIPADAVEWKPSKSWRYAIVRTKPGIISLWDAKTKSARQLDPGAPLQDVAFSPDESQVAVVTSDKNGYSNPRLRVFQISTAQLVHELRVGETDCDRLTLPQWTGDGRYLLAITKPSIVWSDENISLWNANTGRHRGDFVGSLKISGFLLLPPGDQLIAASEGKLYAWNFNAATQEIRKIEGTLPPSKTTP